MVSFLPKHRVFRRLQQLILGLYACTIIITISMIVGPFFNDRAIMDHAVRTPATIRTVSSTYVGVEFQDVDGNYHSPSKGVLYPAKMTHLKPGDMVWVLYDWRNPDLVKVEGRSWTLVLPTALSFFFISTLVVMGLRVALHRYEKDWT